MKLLEALKILQENPSTGSEELNVFLACGFTPLHLQTFLGAHLREMVPERRICTHTGLFGDCLGNLERLPKSPVNAVAVVVEWDDLDPRLGLRQLGGWRPGIYTDIRKNVDMRLNRFLEAIARAATDNPVALCLPTLPFPPISFQPRRQAGGFDLELLECLSTFSTRIAKQRGVRVASQVRLEAESPARERRDVKSELTTGFPYRLPHASTVASFLAQLISAPTPKKGLITDLDDVLWRGILGEVGVRGITWDIDHHSLIHGLYQQLLGSLAETGILIAAASKNECELVEQALRRGDLVVNSRYLFPIEARWSPKSASVGRILQTWNIAADSVVFVDDSPIELAEVKAAYPDIHCLRFPTNDDQEAYNLLGELRDLFGKETILAEDAIRRESLRHAAPVLESVAGSGASLDRFLQEAEAELTLDFTKDPADPRAWELVNKTNQFNLNGRRYTEGLWREYLHQADTFLLRAAYRDKFGPLGTIAVLTGRRQPEPCALEIDVWVMSCRAFSRRIEHRCLEQLFQQSGVEQIGFDYQPTPRNGPLQDFFASLLDGPPQPGFRLTREAFLTHCPPLSHRCARVPHG
jgi:FkbH-like protein